jgi:hypothetical protein
MSPELLHSVLSNFSLPGLSSNAEIEEMAEEEKSHVHESFQNRLR